MPKCRICKTNISNVDLKEDRAIKVTVNEKNIYFCSEKHCSEYFIAEKEKQKERKQLDEIDKFVKYELFNYTENQILPTSFFSRLLDLRNGTTRGRNHNVKNGNKDGYSYDIILETFKENKSTIIWCMQNKLFTANEGQRINYIMAIIENSINDVYDKYKKIENRKEKEIDMGFAMEYETKWDGNIKPQQNDSKFSEDDLL